MTYFDLVVKIIYNGESVSYIIIIIILLLLYFVIIIIIAMPSLPCNCILLCMDFRVLLIKIRISV